MLSQMNREEKKMKIDELQAKAAKYEEKLRKLLVEEDKAPGARYGNEYLQNEVKVLEDFIRTVKIEIARLKAS